MSSVCITACVRDTSIPPRATYLNLYKWPESDAEFVRSVTSKSRRSGGQSPRPRVVDSVSCRQMYLRSYPFTREDDQVPHRTINCFGGCSGSRKKKKRVERHRRCKRRRVRMREGKEMSWRGLFRMFRKLLSYSATVDVVE